MVTVEAGIGQVERRLVSGGLSCPGCAGVLAGWGHARKTACWLIPDRRCSTSVSS